MAYRIYPLLAASLALALTFTLGCEEKSGGKTADSPKPAVEAVAKKVSSCKAGEKVKLLESTTDNNGKLLRKLEYDNQNRLVKIDRYDDGKIFSTITIAYNGDDLVTVEGVSYGEKSVSKFVKKGNAITVNDKDVLTVNEDDCIIDIRSEESVYKDCNETSKGIIFYSYDNKKSPLSNSNTPKWLILPYSENYLLNKNNILQQMPDGDIGVPGISYEYKYDSDGFPTNQTGKACSPDWEPECNTMITRYTYSLVDCK